MGAAHCYGQNVFCTGVHALMNADFLHAALILR
jgi:hypothetical protein